jgi:formylglycine-generating enzyme required for sulfatase activity
MMGSPETEMSDSPAGARRTNEAPLHDVTISRPFYISAYKVTQWQYEEIMGTNPSKFPGKDNPVDAVTWEDAVLFCEKASARTHRHIYLPTEAQWEYAVRAGTRTRYSFGDDENKVGDYAWFRENSRGMTHPVGQKSPNPWGLFDVHGLLWEYCSDFYADSYANAGNTDPQGPASGPGHVVRGGTYGSRPPFLRSAIRIQSPSASDSKDIRSHFGFRVAADLAK